jgi:hypothetical protein
MYLAQTFALKMLNLYQRQEKTEITRRLILYSLHSQTVFAEQRI